MSLARYKEKRNFRRTPEPSGKTGRKKVKAPVFVIQKHDATRLHYDFRLEMGGMLKSWAVPKGIPTVKGDKRLAMEVEDHPLDYGGFEGTIPEGNYGAGTVMLWDEGTYEVFGVEPLRAWQQGKIHFELHGKKLNGEWALAKMRPRERTDKPAWLLLKSGEDLPAKVNEKSVLSGKTMEEIATGRGKVWQSSPASRVREKRPHERDRQGVSDKSETTAKRGGVVQKGNRFSAVSGTLLKDLPEKPAAFVQPMNALLTTQIPVGSAWIYEIKWDGYRAIAVKQKDQVRLFSRRARDVTPDFPELAVKLGQVPVVSFVLDGEIVALDETGHASFQRMQNFRQRPPGNEPPGLYYYVFDLLNLEDRDLTQLPLEQRKQLAEALVQSAGEPIRFSAGLRGDPKLLLAQAEKNRLEGLIAKRADSCYEPDRRTGAWQKIKIVLEQEFVVGGYTAPTGGRSCFGALAVGYYQDGKLLFASKVGTGFDEQTLKMLYEKFQPLKTERCPFANLPSPRASDEGLTLAEMRRCTWLRPELVCEVRFSQWTDGGGLREPVFLGLRDDKNPAEVIRETADKI